MRLAGFPGSEAVTPGDVVTAQSASSLDKWSSIWECVGPFCVPGETYICLPIRIIWIVAYLSSSPIQTSSPFWLRVFNVFRIASDLGAAKSPLVARPAHAVEASAKLRAVSTTLKHISSDKVQPSSQTNAAGGEEMVQKRTKVIKIHLWGQARPWPWPGRWMGGAFFWKPPSFSPAPREDNKWSGGFAVHDERQDTNYWQWTPGFPS